ncbi:hypothetical protein OG258_19980 [Streptomyces mirabilis]|uniref:hypothetical protein n=1 Tax=Streptomyces mirabilis TaxID=68239 RepID=UPI002E2C44ED|nr:hypothetical protein [Streptomyces mirabilis]
MNWLELWEFFQWLPTESMTRSAMAGDHTRRRWTERDHMIATGLTLQHLQFLTLLQVNGAKGSALPKLFEWDRPDLRTPEQLAEDEAREARQAAIRARFYEATRPGAQQDTEHARRLAEAREEHLRLMAQAAEPTTESGERCPPTSEPSSRPSLPTSPALPPGQMPH